MEVKLVHNANENSSHEQRFLNSTVGLKKWFVCSTNNIDNIAKHLKVLKW